MSHDSRIALVVFALLVSPLAAPARGQVHQSPGSVPLPPNVDLSQSFSLRVLVRWDGPPPTDLPLVVGNKDWEAGEVRDYTTNNSYGLGRESGTEAGFAISVMPDGAWTWNAGDGRARIDHRPEAADQGVADGRWHEVGFAVDRASSVVHLFHDGRRVALHDLQGVGSLASPMESVQAGPGASLQLKDIRLEPGVLLERDVAAAFAEQFGANRRPKARAVWDGKPLKVLAWNIWHGGRRKGRDEGVRRVVEVIEESGADIVLMQETYGSGPRIAGRLGFDYFLRSSNLSIMSRFPITDVHRLHSGFRFGGVTLELRPDLHIEAYSLWINYLPDVGKAMEEGATGEQLARADAKTRGAEMDAILGELLPHLDASPALPVLVGGDFNSGSHLDWTQAAARLDNHDGRVTPWPVSLSMGGAGFIDTYRTAHPSPLTDPGHTWSPEFTESHQDRIDYVYASAGDWRVIDSRVLREHPRGWPSDHAAVLSTVELVDPAPALKVMSYNIHYGVGMDKVRDLERIAAVIKSDSPDIVGLQEIGNKAMADELGRLTGMTAVFGASKGSDEAYGDAILTKHPFDWVGNLSIPSASASRYQAMAIDVDLSATYGPGVEVRFINTHFDWTDSIGSQEARRAAVNVVERGLCRHMPGLAILAGDLNAVPGSLPLEDLDASGWRLPLLGQPMATCGAPGKATQIDYLLVRPKRSWQILDVRVLDEPVASDHRPVVLTARPIR